MVVESEALAEVPGIGEFVAIRIGGPGGEDGGLAGGEGGGAVEGDEGCDVATEGTGVDADIQVFLGSGAAACQRGDVDVAAGEGAADGDGAVVFIADAGDGSESRVDEP